MSEANGRGLPKGWVDAGLGAIGTLLCGQSPPSPTVNREGRGVVYVSGPEHWDGAVVHVDKWTTAPVRTVPNGTVFITVKGAGVGTVFPGIEAAIGRDIYAFLPADVVPTSFVTHALRFTTSEIVRQAQGDIPGLSKDHILNHRIAIPPVEEQKRIADKIDELLSDLDAGVAALERVQAKLKHYRAAVLKAAVEGALTAEWRAQHPATEPASALLARILAERRRRWEEAQLQKFKAAGKTPPKDWKVKYEEPVGPNIASLPLLPKEWCWATWPQVGFSQNGRPFPSDAYQDSGTKLLRPGNLYANGFVGWTNRNTRFMPDQYADESPDSIVGGGELVMNLTAQSLKDDFLGRVCMTSTSERCLLNQRLARLSPVVISPQFMLWVFKSAHFREFVKGLNTGSLIQHMFTSQLESFAFPLPPLAEQEAIVEAVEDQLSVVEHLEADLEAKLKSAQALRQSILRHAFTGQLVPQDPKDEPAAVLIQRIAAEREERTRLLKATKRQPAAKRERKKATP